MKVAAVVARVVGSAIGALVLVPLAVLWLVEVGVAGAWKWLPGCVILVAGLAGCAAVTLWWPRRRMRVRGALAALAWGTVAMSAAYWPGVTTRAEVREAFDRVDYDGGVVEPTVWELGADWCVSVSPDLLGCPRLSADYLVDAGGGEDVIRALQDAGFRLVGGTGPRPVEDVDLPMSGSTGVGSRHWLADDAMRVEVTVISERMLSAPMQGMDDGTVFVPTSTERVSLEFFDAENPHQLDISGLGVWTPDASLEDAQPPPGW